MRALAIAILIAAGAGPVAAQVAPTPPVPGAYVDPGQLNLQFQIQEQQRRSIDLDNQLMALEARLRAEQGIATSRAQSARPYISEPYVPGAASAAAAADATPIDTSKLVSIPDDRLAASNAAVRAVTQGQRH